MKSLAKACSLLGTKLDSSLLPACSSCFNQLLWHKNVRAVLLQHIGYIMS
jgi:hypothetical protein